MKVQIETNALSDMLKTVGIALQAKPIADYMSYVKLTAGEGKLTASATNGTFFLSRMTDCRVMEEGEALLDGKLLCQIVSKLPNAECTLDSSDGKKAVIKSGSSRTTLALTEGTMFHAHEIGTTKVSADVDTGNLRKVLSAVRYAIAQMESRQVLTGALLSVKNEKLFTVGLDGFRMAACKTKCMNNGESDFIVPGDSVACLISIASEAACDAKIHASATAMTYEDGKTFFSTSLLAGEYIDYKKIIPKESNTLVKINVKDTKDAVVRAMVISDKNTLVKLQITQDGMTVRSNSELGEAVEVIACDVSGEDIELAFNGRYLLNALSAFDGETAVLKLTTPTAPALLVPSEGDAHLHLVLPVRIGS